VGFSDYVIYVDESGDHSLKTIDPDFPVFALDFCIFEKRRYFEAVVPWFKPSSSSTLDTTLSCCMSILFASRSRPSLP